MMKLATIVKLVLAGAAAAAMIGLKFWKTDRAESEMELDAFPEGEGFEPAEDAGEEAAQTQTCRAEIIEARREMDPVTLQGWSRVTFRCEDGEERKMYFPGENGVYLLKGENGLLEHCDGKFVSFEKDSGEIVGALYHIPAGETEEG